MFDDRIYELGFIPDKRKIIVCLEDADRKPRIRSHHLVGWSIEESPQSGFRVAPVLLDEDGAIWTWDTTRGENEWFESLVPAYLR